jgi:hypothetical protein
VVARTATSHGDAWLVKTTTGTLLRVVPVFEFEASDSFLAALSSDEPDETNTPESGDPETATANPPQR